ncbi:MAG: hypothetical protein KatS3mg076_0864 [Candidatus Binatia bacterium]|nr:MAG: hypothetical protein KatS3mg076_0864 [Candidatus Binatia bacterium]
MSLVDEKERRIVREELGRTLLVEAAAGTGKTTELVRRIVAVLENALGSVESIVAVTFTEKAAGELKLRLRAFLEEARGRHGSGSPERKRLEDALERLEEARVSTIHAFCADLLRERPVEAGVDPEFTVLTEGEANRLFEEAFGVFLERALENPPEGVRRALRRRPSRTDENREAPPSERLRRAAWSLAEWRDFPAGWKRPDFDRKKSIDDLVAEIRRVAELGRNCFSPRGDPLYARTEPLRRFAENLSRSEEVRPRDYDRLEADLVSLATDSPLRNRWRGRGEQYGPGVLRAELLESVEGLLGKLQAFARTADADLAACLERDLRGAVEAYEEMKRREGALDFVDLLLRARDLLRYNEEVRRHYQSRFTHIFVDEFQDTDPLQTEILFLLSSSDPRISDWRRVVPAPGKLFLVGDPKQAIYRFRRADVSTYLEAKKLLVERCGEDAVVQLRTSFRSVPSLQKAVNAAFEPVMQESAEALQPGYVPLAPFRKEHRGQPTLVALPVPRPYGKWKISKEAIEASLPDAVGAFVHWLVEKSGWRVEEDGRRVPVRPDHVCLLFRRIAAWPTGDMARPYVQALESRGVPHLLVGGKSFHEREEILTMRTALAAVEWPDDELSVFATLHGSLFAIEDAELFEYRSLYGRLHPFRVPEELPESLGAVGEALRFLAECHRRRNRRPVAETIEVLLEATRAHAAFVLRPSGEQVLANVLHLVELARSYEASGGLSFRGFVDFLEREAERGEAGEAPILEEGSEGVRLMTVHKAKGLEFPVVVLADITTKLARPTASRVVDAERRVCAQKLAGWSPLELLEAQEVEVSRDEAEGVRVAYVAATRARDLLVVPAVGVGPYEKGWASPLDRVLYPEFRAWEKSKPAPGCPRFGSFTVLEAPPEQVERPCVRPGLHRTAGGVEVVWWDPKKLVLDVEPRFGIRQEELLAKDVQANIVREDVARYREWLERKTAAIEEGSRPSVRVRIVTERAREKTDRRRGSRGSRATPGRQVSRRTTVRGARARDSRFGRPRCGSPGDRVLREAATEDPRGHRRRAGSRLPPGRRGIEAFSPCAGSGGGREGAVPSGKPGRLRRDGRKPRRRRRRPCLRGRRRLGRRGLQDGRRTRAESRALPEAGGALCSRRGTGDGEEGEGGDSATMTEGRRGASAWLFRGFVVGFLLVAASVRSEGRAAPDGRELYVAWCSGCHGEKGDGKGLADPELVPPPRDFTSGKFKIRSTSPRNPISRAELLRTVERGMPGTAMPSFSFLAPEERAAIVGEISRLAGLPEKETVEEVPVPEPPETTPELLEKGKLVYRELGCPVCHGDGGRGDGLASPDLKDVWGNPTPARDLVSGPFRGGEEPREVYLRLAIGMPGTPMPGYGDVASPEDLWALVAYLASIRQRERPPARDPVELGARVFEREHCIACHRLRDRGGRVGPSLDVAIRKLRREWAVEFLTDPLAAGKLYPAVPFRMPRLSLTRKEAEALLTFLARRVGSGSRRGETPRATKAELVAGGAIFRITCSSCHRYGSLEPSVRELEGPDLSRARERLDYEFLPMLFLEGAARTWRAFPWRWADHPGLREADAKAVRAFLWQGKDRAGVEPAP